MGAVSSRPVRAGMTDAQPSLRDGLTTAAWSLAAGLALTAWGLASVVIVPVDHLVRRVRRGNG
jgi:hypothetical protein